MTSYSQTICHLQVEQGAIAYCLQRSPRRRTMAIRISEDGSVKVYAPQRLSEEKIRYFVSQESSWIIDGVRRVAGRIKVSSRSLEEDGAEFLFLGQRRPVQETVPCGKPDLIRPLLEKWCRDQAREFLAVRVFQWARRMNLEVRDVQVRTQKRLWGCCYPDRKKIHLNWLIIMAPVEAIDYVIVHELCHLWVPDHSPKFWARVAEHYPDYPAQKRWFKDHAHQLRL